MLYEVITKSAEPLILIVPPGTQVIDNQTDEVLIDLLEIGQKELLLEGGKGGLLLAFIIKKLKILNVAVMIIRITSYNVCYTKLLRNISLINTGIHADCLKYIRVEYFT